MTTQTRVNPRAKADAFLSKLEVSSTPKVFTTVTEPNQNPTPKIIPLSAYWEDAKARWEIHKKEIDELIADIKKLINFLKPLVVDAFNKVKERIMSFIKRK